MKPFSSSRRYARPRRRGNSRLSGRLQRESWRVSGRLHRQGSVLKSDAASIQAMDEMTAELVHLRKELASAQGDAAEAAMMLASSTKAQNKAGPRASLSFASSDAITRVSALEAEVEELQSELEKAKEGESHQRRRRKECERDLVEARKDVESHHRRLASHDAEEMARLKQEGLSAPSSEPAFG